MRIGMEHPATPQRSRCLWLTQASHPIYKVLARLGEHGSISLGTASMPMNYAKTGLLLAVLTGIFVAMGGLVAGTTGMVIALVVAAGRAAAVAIAGAPIGGIGASRRVARARSGTGDLFALVRASGRDEHGGACDDDDARGQPGPGTHPRIVSARANAGKKPVGCALPWGPSPR